MDGSEVARSSTVTTTLQFTEAAARELCSAVSVRWPLEACGLCLVRAATPTRIERCVELPNAHPEPRHGYRLHVSALLAQLVLSRKTGWVLRAFFHSHPEGVATPSEEDIAFAAEGGVSLWPSVDHIIASTRERQLHHVARFEVDGVAWRRAPLCWPDETP